MSSPSTTLVYTRFELKRLIRNRQNVLFSVLVPLIIFFAVASPNAQTNISPKGAPEVTFARFYFAGMLAFGAIAAVVSGGARIALERQVGWNRQLRLTPLPARTYLRTKVLTSYLVALVSIALLTAAAVLIGAKLNLHDWAIGVGLTLIALVPFAAMGIALGHLVKGDSMGPIIGGLMSFFAVIGGAYFPLTGGFLADIAKYVPSYWLVQGNKAGIGGQSWTPLAWAVVAVWAVVMAGLAAWAYRRDTARV